MKLRINDKIYVLEDLVDNTRKIISIGRKTVGVYNTIEIDSEMIDTFQCQITKSKDCDEWLLHHGQYRTECPRGLKSARDRACNSCRSVCVSISVANPHYSWRNPDVPTLINNIPTNNYTPIHQGDTICIGDKTIEVIE